MTHCDPRIGAAPRCPHRHACNPPEAQPDTSCTGHVAHESNDSPQLSHPHGALLPPTPNLHSPQGPAASRCSTLVPPLQSAVQAAGPSAPRLAEDPSQGRSRRRHRGLTMRRPPHVTPQGLSKEGHASLGPTPRRNIAIAHFMQSTLRGSRPPAVLPT